MVTNFKSRTLSQPSRSPSPPPRALALTLGGPVSLPVLRHAERIPSGERGCSLSFLLGVRKFFESRGNASYVMEQVCKEKGSPNTVCALTLCTGLSLMESCVYVARRDGLEIDGLFGGATTLFSYSWTGTKLVDMLDAIDDTVHRMEATKTATAAAAAAAAENGGGDTRGTRGEHFFWIDMFCASQNLLAGTYKDPAITKEADPAGYKERKEDTDTIFDQAISATDVVFLYCAPLLGTWIAPPHPFLSPKREERGKPPKNWKRKGPSSITRAWCLFEVTELLSLLSWLAGSPD